ncbi:hypothetical protein GCM10027030_00830 [Luteococcus sediminum]
MAPTLMGRDSVSLAASATVRLESMGVLPTWDVSPIIGPRTGRDREKRDLPTDQMQLARPKVGRASCVQWSG